MKLRYAFGILIGEREDISEEIENNFKTSNLTHMLAVSGSHITYIISVCNFFYNYIIFFLL